MAGLLENCQPCNMTGIYTVGWRMWKTNRTDARPHEYTERTWYRNRTLNASKLRLPAGMMEFSHDPLTNQTRTIDDQIISDSNQSTPLSPLDPAYFDYVYYVEDLTQVSEPWSEDTAFLPTSIVYGIAFVAGLSGNILVMFTLLADKQWRSVISFFLFSLALADVVFLLVCLPYEIILKFSSGWTGGKAFCKLAGFVEMLTALTSVLNLVAVSIERYRPA